MFELPVLPADVDHQTIPTELQRLFFAVLAHLLRILGVLHFDERLKTRRKASFVSDRSKLKDLLLTFPPPRPSTCCDRLGVGVEAALPYLPLDPVGEVFADFPERLCQFEDGLV